MFQASKLKYDNQNIKIFKFVSDLNRDEGMPTT